MQQNHVDMTDIRIGVLATEGTIDQTVKIFVMTTTFQFWKIMPFIDITLTNNQLLNKYYI